MHSFGLGSGQRKGGRDGRETLHARNGRRGGARSVICRAASACHPMTSLRWFYAVLFALYVLRGCTRPAQENVATVRFDGRALFQVGP
jgi:hypothetical protein